MAVVEAEHAAEQLRQKEMERYLARTHTTHQEHAKLEHRHTAERRQSEKRIKQLINEHEMTLAALLGNAVTRIHHQIPHDGEDHNRVALMTAPMERGKVHAQYT